MGELTEEELKLAPDWAFYYVTDGEDILFVDRKYRKACWLTKDFGLEDCFSYTDELDYLLESGVMEIPQYPFDITKHEVVDQGYVGVKIDGDIYVKRKGFTINKDSSIAIAKHFSLTSEDLK